MLLPLFSDTVRCYKLNQAPSTANTSTTPFLVVSPILLGTHPVLRQCPPLDVI